MHPAGARRPGPLGSGPGAQSPAQGRAVQGAAGPARAARTRAVCVPLGTVLCPALRVCPGCSDCDLFPVQFFFAFPTSVLSGDSVRCLGGSGFLQGLLLRASARVDLLTRVDAAVPRGCCCSAWTCCPTWTRCPAWTCCPVWMLLSRMDAAVPRGPAVPCGPAVPRGPRCPAWIRCPTWTRCPAWTRCPPDWAGFLQGRQGRCPRSLLG